MYEDYEDMEEIEEIDGPGELKNAENLLPEEVQELLEEDSKAGEGMGESSELDSQRRSSINFGSAGDDVRFYSRQLESDINSNNPSESWTRKDSYELAKAEAQAEKEKQ